MLLIIEICYNVFPSTPLSSFCLQVCHYVLYFGLLMFQKIPFRESEESKKEK